MILSGNLIKEWSSLSELGSKLNINKSNVANYCCRIAKDMCCYILEIHKIIYNM